MPQGELHASRQTILSPCRKYRYTLWREWGSEVLFTGEERVDDYAVFIGLNPSTADETKDDPTIRRCVNFAKHWGYGAFLMMNLFAWRDTKPANMMKASDPVGPLNDFYLFELAKNAGIVIAAWGANGNHKGRADYIADLFKEAGIKLTALRTNDDGSPGHPLYVPAETKPIAWPVLTNMTNTNGHNIPPR
jgi:hypothetical protein